MSNDLPVSPDSVDSPSLSDSQQLPESINDSIPLLESKKGLLEYLGRVIPQAKPLMRVKVRDFLWAVSRGERVAIIMERLKWSWQQWSVLCNSNRELRPVFRDMQDMGEDWRKIQRRDEVHRRASEGVEKGVYYKGVRVDTVREYSDKLLELAVKADDPDKYADRSKSESTIKSVSAVFNFDIDKETGKRLLEEKRRKEREQAE